MLRDKGVSDRAYRLAGLLLDYEGPLGCVPTEARLADDLGVSEDTIARHLLELENYGFLKRVGIGNRRNGYLLTPTYPKPRKEDKNAPPRRPPSPRTLRPRRPKPLGSEDVDKAAPVQASSQVMPISNAQRASNLKTAPVRPRDDLPAQTADSEGAPVRPSPQDDAFGMPAPVRTSDVVADDSFAGAPVQVSTGRDVVESVPGGADASNREEQAEAAPVRAPLAAAIHAHELMDKEPPSPMYALVRASANIVAEFGSTEKREPAELSTDPDGGTSAPMVAAPVQKARPHLCAVNNTYEIENHHQQAALAVGERAAGDDVSRDAGIRALAAVGVFVRLDRMRPNMVHGGKLTSDDMIAWAEWVTGAQKGGIENPRAFAADAVRNGRTLIEAFPDLHDALIRDAQKQAKARAIAAAEAELKEKGAKADALIAALDPAARERLAELAAKDPGVRSTTAGSFVHRQLLLAAERKLVWTLDAASAPAREGAGGDGPVTEQVE